MREELFIGRGVREVREISQSRLNRLCERAVQGDIAPAVRAARKERNFGDNKSVSALVEAVSVGVSSHPEWAGIPTHLFHSLHGAIFHALDPSTLATSQEVISQVAENICSHPRRVFKGVKLDEDSRVISALILKLTPARLDDLARELSERSLSQHLMIHNALMDEWEVDKVQSEHLVVLPDANRHLYLHVLAGDKTVCGRVAAKWTHARRGAWRRDKNRCVECALHPHPECAETFPHHALRSDEKMRVVQKGREKALERLPRSLSAAMDLADSAVISQLGREAAERALRERGEEQMREHLQTANPLPVDKLSHIASLLIASPTKLQRMKIKEIL